MLARLEREREAEGSTAVTNSTSSHRLSAILDLGLWARVERDELQMVARSPGVGVELHYLDVPTEELWRRIEARNATPPLVNQPIGRADVEERLTVIQAPRLTKNWPCTTHRQRIDSPEPLVGSALPHRPKVAIRLARVPALCDGERFDLVECFGEAVPFDLDLLAALEVEPNPAPPGQPD